MKGLNDREWLDANRATLSVELAGVRRLLTGDAGAGDNGASETPAATAPMLDFLCGQLQLSGFERSLILLCAGMDLEGDWPQLCATARGDAGGDYPSFGLALSVLPGAHWSALSPQAPLRYWQLLQVGDPSRLTTARLFLDERILFLLLGVGALDRRLAGLTRPLPAAAALPASHQQQAECLRRMLTENDGQPAVITLHGDDPGGATAVAVQTCAMLGWSPFSLRADDIPNIAEERNLLACLLTREWLLGRAVMIIEAAESSAPSLGALLDALAAPAVVLGGAPAVMQRPCTRLEVRKPLGDEQLMLWRGAAGGAGVDDAELAPLTVHFDFTVADIAAAAAEARVAVEPGASPTRALWRACCDRSRTHLEKLAQRISPFATWDDLILPAGQLAILHDIVCQVRHRATVYRQWGFAAKSARGLGISALFVGESGTGKTLAAEVIAADLDLDLYRIDLAAVVSKYIGETEKNLERLFRAAEASGAILLFDEADALFGKRSEVKDSHDRYANIELAYLLQRMETYRGLSILTTNLKSLLDTAFMRRIRFVVQFPFPDRAQRAEIWRRIFPEPLPRDPLDIEQLARVHLAGGNIRNIAMNAAFLAAENGGRLGMTHLVRAARVECAKLEKPLSEAEIGGWR
jgi:hypothetical protein